MKLPILNPDGLWFPPVESASPDGLLAVGGNLESPRLLAAYRLGIFPWYNPGQPILWWSPDPRMVLYPDEFHRSRSLLKTLRRGHLTVGFDQDFAGVLDGCAGPRRHPSGGEVAGTWITADMRAAYLRLHAEGHAHSVECRHEGKLVGGLYGVAIGGAFFGESMFSLVPDASKAALSALCAQLHAWSFHLIDCQMSTPHLIRLGAREIPRHSFLDQLGSALTHPGRPGRWPVQPVAT